MTRGDSGFNLAKTTDSISSEVMWPSLAFFLILSLCFEGRFEPVGASNRKPFSPLGFKGLLIPPKADSAVPNLPVKETKEMDYLCRHQNMGSKMREVTIPRWPQPGHHNPGTTSTKHVLLYMAGG